MQFEAFVDRLRDAVAAAMPTAKVEVEAAEARVVRPDPEHRPEQAQPSDAPGYDSRRTFTAPSARWSRHHWRSAGTNDRM